MFHPYLKNCKYTSSKSKCIDLQQLDTLSEKIWSEKIFVTKPNFRQFSSTKNFTYFQKFVIQFKYWVGYSFPQSN